MPESNIDNYRLTSMEEPTDEMLAQIMSEVTQEVKQTDKIAIQKHYARLQEEVRKAKERFLLL